MTDRGRLNKIISVCGAIILIGIILFSVYQDFKNIPEYTYDYLGKGARDITGEIPEGVIEGYEQENDRPSRKGRPGKSSERGKSSGKKSARRSAARKRQ